MTAAPAMHPLPDAEQIGGRALSPKLAWAVGLGEHELLQELNRALGVMRSSGTLSYILNRWIPVQVEVR